MNNDTIKLLNLEQFNLNIKSLQTTKVNNIIRCYITLKKGNAFCNSCGSGDCVIKEYYTKKIIHSISNNNPCIIMYNARRYKCKCCGSTFYERNPFASSYDKTSTYTRFAVLEALKDHTATFVSVSKRFNISKTSVINIFDTYVNPNRRPFSEIISIDEFYTSKTRQYKYACVFFDFCNKKIIEVFPSRHKQRLAQNISSIPKNERNIVKYAVIDMWQSYKDLVKIYFPNALVAVDSFHVIKNLNESMNMIRIQIMKSFDKRTNKLVDNDMYYYMLKKFHYFFTKNFDDIYEGQINIHKIRTKWTKYEIINYLFSISPDLKQAYYLKEQYREFNLCTNLATFDEDFEELLDGFYNSKFPEFIAFGGLLSRWKEEIRNSFHRYNGRRLSNGPIEGANSRIKTLFKSANGYVKFERLRNRIIYSLNKDVPVKGNINK